jgi:FkbM family methyltransferase
MRLADWANGVLRRHEHALKAVRRLTGPARRAALPVLAGNGRGLRVHVGPSSLMRVVSTVEAEVERTFLDLLHPGDVVYDVGANIGWFSLLAARKVGPEGAVFAFEPSLANVVYLRMNVETNELTNVVAIPAAVEQRDGWGSFSEDSSLEGHLSSDGGSLVPLVSLDAWPDLVGCRPPDVLKVDVEGAEADVLRGMKTLLRTAKPVLIIELHGTDAEVAEVLGSAGYTHSPIGAATDDADRGSPSHIIARPDETAV